MSPAETIEAYLSAQAIPFERSDDHVWSFQLHGERKLSIPVALVTREKTLSIESFFMRRPLEEEGAFYRLLLARNMRPSRMRFAADQQGDVYLIGEAPLDRLDALTLDAIFGELLYTSDQMFDAAIATGFASYQARDEAWRAQQARDA